MRIRAALVLATALAMTADGRPGRHENPAARADGTWLLSSLGEGEGLVAAAPDVTVELTLQDGRVLGFGGVNTFRGTYEMGPTGRISFGPLASTRRAGPGAAMSQEAIFLAALESTERFDIHDTELVLSDGHGATVAVLGPHPAARASGTGQ